MTPFARGCADFVGEVHRPISVIILSIGLVALPFVWTPSVELAAVMAVPAGALSWFVQARSSENRTQIKADAEVKTAETAMTGRPAVQSVQDAATPPAGSGAPQ